MFRPPSLLAPRIVPTAATPAGQLGLLHPGTSCFVTSARTGYANRPKTGNWRYGDLHPARLSALSAAPITLSSSLIRTHAPSLYPPSDFRFSPYTKGLCRLLPAPCCVKALPNAITVVLPCVPGPLLQLLPRCCFPFLPLGHWPSPSKHGSALASLHHCYFGWRAILELQSFLYVTAHRFVRLTGSSYPHTTRVGQPRLLRPRISRLVTCPVQRLC